MFAQGTFENTATPQREICRKLKEHITSIREVLSNWYEKRIAESDVEDISITVAYKANSKSRGKVHRKLIFNEFLSFYSR